MEQVKLLFYEGEATTVLHESDVEYIIMNDEYELKTLLKQHDYDVVEYEIKDLSDISKKLVFRQFSYWDKFKHEYVKTKGI